MSHQLWVCGMRTMRCPERSAINSLLSYPTQWDLLQHTPTHTHIHALPGNREELHPVTCVSCVVVRCSRHNTSHQWTLIHRLVAVNSPPVLLCTHIHTGSLMTSFSISSVNNLCFNVFPVVKHLEWAETSTQVCHVDWSVVSEYFSIITSVF